MSRTLTQLNELVKFHARDSRVDLITNTSNLSMVNQVYRQLLMDLEWGEGLVEDVSLTTTSGVGTYLYPATAPAQVYSVSVESDSGNSSFGTAIFGEASFGGSLVRPRVVPKANSELEWELVGREPASDHTMMYKMLSEASILKIELRPTPVTTGRIVQIRGIVEPAELTVADSVTVFRDITADDILALLIAGEYSSREGSAELEGKLMGQAQNNLVRYKRLQSAQ